MDEITRIRISQQPVEVANQPANRLRMTQAVIEIVNHPPNNLRISQICIEVAVKNIPQNYTDGAASSNFAF